MEIDEFNEKLDKLSCELLKDYWEQKRKITGNIKIPSKNNIKSDTVIVKDSIPIPWFGNSKSYFRSSAGHRILTVGLNPSNAEFPVVPFEGSIEQRKITPELIRDVCDRYFEVNPTRWFKSGYMSHFEDFKAEFEKAVSGKRKINIAYAKSDSSSNNDNYNALHIDYCTDIATDPTWSKLDGYQVKNGVDSYQDLQQFLKDGFRDKFIELFDILDPDIVFVSMDRDSFKKMWCLLQKNKIGCEDQHGKKLFNDYYKKFKYEFEQYNNSKRRFMYQEIVSISQTEDEPKKTIKMFFAINNSFSPFSIGSKNPEKASWKSREAFYEKLREKFFNKVI